MRRLLIFPLFFAIALLLPAASSWAAEKDWMSAERLRADVEFLAGEELAGRGFGSGGAQLAAFYILRQMRDAGLRASVQAFREGGRIGHNVVGVTKGWYKRYIVVGAYFDALGRIGDVIYPGADANASGVAALLSLLRTLPELCRGDVGLIFVAFDGHSANLSGSREFFARYCLDYEISFFANMEILGSDLVPPRKDRPEYMIALGGAGLSFALDRAARAQGLSIEYDYYGSAGVTELFYRRISDQKWFLSAGVPSVMFTSGITDHTNKVSDLAATLNYPLLSRRVRTIFGFLAGIVGSE